MFEKIIIGVIIGLFGGFLAARIKSQQDKEVRAFYGLGFLFFGLIAIGFIFSSFSYGAIYGAMALCEIVIGFFIPLSLLGNKSK